VWTKAQIDGVNYLLKHKQEIRAILSGQGEHLYTDHNKVLQAPYELYTVGVRPLWMCKTDDYYIMCAQVPSSLVHHWLCQFTGTLLTNDRQLELLVHIEEWIDWDFPKPTDKSLYSSYARAVSRRRKELKQQEVVDE
jgi:hypothetical protein